MEEVLKPCDFDDEADIQQTMDAVIKMAALIQNYVAENTEVTLHVDMTG